MECSEGFAEFCSAGILPSLQMENQCDLGHMRKRKVLWKLPSLDLGHSSGYVVCTVGFPRIAVLSQELNCIVNQEMTFTRHSLGWAPCCSQSFPRLYSLGVVLFAHTGHGQGRKSQTDFALDYTAQHVWGHIS